MLTALPSAAAVLDVHERVLRSTAAARAFGLVADERLAVDELAQLARQVLRDEQAHEANVEVPCGRRGSRQDTASFFVRAAPLGVDLVLVFALDQTELRRVETVRRDFVANVSHELKTPIGALSLLAETVEEAADDPEGVRRFASRMHHEATRLSTLVQELITLSRIQGGDPVPDPVPVAVNEALDEAVDRCTLTASAKDVTLARGGDEGVVVSGDEELIVTAVRNLIDNAISYSPEGTRVTVTACRRDGFVDIRVSDQGVGIAEQDRERIFERFYRVDPARSRRSGGTGLGLAIVKHVATNHGGEVSVWSREDVGSTFTISLPAHERGHDGAADTGRGRAHSAADTAGVREAAP